MKEFSAKRYIFLQNDSYENFFFGMAFVYAKYVFIGRSTPTIDLDTLIEYCIYTHIEHVHEGVMF